MAVKRNTVAGANLTTALGGAPAANDDVIVSEGATTYNAGTDISTNEINTMKVTRGFRGQLGTASSHVVAKLSAATYTGTLYYDGTNAGDAYIKGASGGDIQKVIIKDTGKGTFFCCGETYTLIQMDAGNCEVGGSAVLVTGLYNGGILTVYDNATAITSLTCRNMERVHLERSITAAVLEGCPTATFDSYGDAIATLTLENSTLVYNGGTITSLTLEPFGVLDLRGIVQDIAITDTTLHPNSKILYPNNGFTVTHTNAATLVGGGPEWYQ